MFDKLVPRAWPVAFPGCSIGHRPAAGYWRWHSEVFGDDEVLRFDDCGKTGPLSEQVSL